MEVYVMGFTSTLANFFRSRWVGALILLAAANGSATLAGEPPVEFDFARLAAYCEAGPITESAARHSREKLIEVVLPISVRFHGIPAEDVEEILVEIDASATGLRVYDFWPTTRLASDVVQAIETTKTARSSRSLDATLGGALPVPVGELVAHVTPSVTAGVGQSDVTTEKLSRLPPKEAVVVSGTSSEGRGVFFKLKQSSQTLLEGVHEVSVTFVAPADWEAGAVRVVCSARGQRKVFWMDQPATFGERTVHVQLYRAGDAEMRELAEQRVRKADQQPRRRSLFWSAKNEVEEAVESTSDEAKS
jgi:hypothetical protein